MCGSQCIRPIHLTKTMARRGDRCNDEEVIDPRAPWTHEGTYCDLLLTAQASSIICLAFGFCGGVIAAFLSAGAITREKFQAVACASSVFMLVEVRVVHRCRYQSFPSLPFPFLHPLPSHAHPYRSIPRPHSSWRP